MAHALDNALVSMFASMGIRVVDVTPPSPAELRSREAMAKMSDDELKALWDDPEALDGHECLCCDDIYAELRRRGHDDICCF